MNTKKMKIHLILILLIFVIVFIISMISLNKYNNNHFKQGSSIEKVNVSKLNVDEAYDKISNSLSQRKIKIVDENETIFEISKKDTTNINKKDLISILKSKTTKSDLKQITDLDTKLNEKMNQINLDNYSTPSVDATLIKNESNDFVITEPIIGNEIDVEELKNEIKQSINDNQFNQSVNIDDYIIQPSITSDDKELNEELKQLSELQLKNVTVNINGENDIIPQELIKSSINLDGTIDGTQFDDYLYSLNSKYSTINKQMDFKTTNGLNVSIFNDLYGWSIDTSATNEAIKDYLINESNQEKSINAILINPDQVSKEQFGGSYVEVDLNQQKCYIYKDNKQALSWDVITGSPGFGATPTGLFSIYIKQSPSILRGKNENGTKYETKVNYWLQFTTSGVGIHDASWQTQGFGGDKYKTLGSHGCVNTSPSIMPQVYDLCYIGMPVIVHGSIY